jgi:hypothetical protein
LPCRYPEAGKRFFLKKEAKTFATWRARGINAHAKFSKVFWFFFSKKNSSLANRATRRTAKSREPYQE